MKKLVNLIIVVLVFVGTKDLPKVPSLSFAQDSKPNLIKTIGRGTVNDLEASPDGSTIATAGSDGIWLYSNKLEDVTHFGQTMDDEFTNLAWSPNGTEIATGSRLNGIQIWDVSTGKLLSNFNTTNAYFPRVIAWSPDNKFIATAQGDSSRKIIEIRSVDDWQLVYSLHNEIEVDYLVWHQNSQYLVSQSHSNIFVWDIGSQSVTAQFSDEDNYFVSTEWQPNTHRLTIVGRNEDHAITVWDIDSEEVIDTFSSESKLSLVEWNTLGHSFIAFDGKGIIFLDLTDSVKTTVLIEDIDIREISLEWNLEKQELIAFGLDSSIRIWDIQGHKLTELNSLHNLYIGAIDWSPTADLIASAEYLEEINSIKVWDTNNGSLLYKYFTPSGGTLNSLSWNPQGNMLLASYHNPYPNFGDTFIWDFSQGYNVEPKVIQHQGNVVSATWNADGSKFFTVSLGQENNINVWNTEDLTQLETIPTDNSTVGVFPSRSGNLVAIVHSFNSGFNKNFIEIYDVDSKTTQLTIYLPDNKFAFNTPVIWDQADKTLLIHGTSIAKGAVWVANLTTSELSGPYYGPNRDLDWNLENDQVALAGENIYFLSGELEYISSIEDLSSRPISVSWEHTGEKIAVATGSNIIYIFSIP